MKYETLKVVKIKKNSNINPASRYTKTVHSNPFPLIKVYVFFFVLTECISPCSDENTTLEVPHVALVPIQTSSPERRITSQKEIIAGEERPKYLLIKQLQEAQGMCCIYVCDDCTGLL